MKATPSLPLKAHHRLLLHMISAFYGDAKIDPRPEELDRISRVFQRAGGSWDRFYAGSMDEVDLLKKVLKVAVAKKFISASSKWSG